MTNSLQDKILKSLLSLYEKSRTFKGTNKVNQSFSKKLDVLFPVLKDLSNRKAYDKVTEAVSDLEKRGLITVGLYNEYPDSVALNTDNLQKIYDYLGETPKAELNNKTIEILEKYKDLNAILSEYCTRQIENIKDGKKLEAFKGFSDNFPELEDVLKGVDAALRVETETFERDFSVSLYNDSKRFEAIKSKIQSILFEYGDFPDKDTVLQDLNILKNPGHVYLKGNCVVYINNQVIDLADIRRDIGISSASLSDISRILVKGQKVITIENLTAFNDFNEPDTTAVYLGGFHNHSRRELLCKIYRDNPDIKYYHFGDIDVGGFRIFFHLKEKTHIPFSPYCMDIATLKKYIKYKKDLTMFDKTYLPGFLEGEFGETAAFMLENNCKLEQEALRKFVNG